MSTKETIGQRGKKAEKEVDVLLKKWNGRASFSHYRMPDARAAMGRLSASPGDFIYFTCTCAGFIEIKSTEHSYRIAKDKISQLPTLKKFEMAGARSVILIHHSTENVWRAVTPDMLIEGSPSWDLSKHQTYSTAEAALISTGYFL